MENSNIPKVWEACIAAVERVKAEAPSDAHLEGFAYGFMEGWRALAAAIKRERDRHNDERQTATRATKS